ncbi:tunicamycin resistance protein [Paenibacillus yonginensis]|uniref:Tunicamycin resistance protein n=1 Tax=Paenibacillus yonginensis TaxID=1462996 RepID=A0A1B1MZ15_9BACL|nr:AAA family ATPase [Paenibacillus yonginensis]ANS74411.1 tunicamycin resistance protein [Paenibacillus yonginensis]
MILWINGAFGSGKTTVSYELNRKLPNSFVYDPENAGYFIRNNTPKSIWKEDFQDHEIWREINFSLLQQLSREYDGMIIVPMTLVNPQYFNEIVQRLRSEGVQVVHFTLFANRETLLKRLKSRGDHRNSWPAQQIDRCIEGLSQDLFNIHIHTDDLTVDEIVDQIARECNLDLNDQPDRKEGVSMP